MSPTGWLYSDEDRVRGGMRERERKRGGGVFGR